MKEEMIFFEKVKKFNEKMYETLNFSSDEVNWIINHEKLGKMFDVMDVKKTLRVFNDPFACMISNIIYQQVAFKLARFSEVMLFDYLDFNIIPQSILKLSDKEFKKFKIFGRRVEYIRNFAKYVIDNNSFFENIYNVSEKAIEDEFIKISGIGSWSIEMFFIFGLGKKDILSLKDLIIIKGIENLYGKMDKNELLEIKNELIKYGTIVSINLWSYIEDKYYLKNKL